MMIINDPIGNVALKLFYEGYFIQNRMSNFKRERELQIGTGSKHKLLIAEIDYEMFVLYIDGDRENGFVFELHHLDDLPRNIEVYCNAYAKAMEIDYESVFKFKQ